MAACCTYHRPTYFLKLPNRSHTKKPAYKRKILKNFLKKVQKKGPAGRKRSDRKGNRTRQKNKRGNSKLESHDSPEIPDRGETSDIHGLPSGDLWNEIQLKGP